jgi:hypothetical protein
VVVIGRLSVVRGQLSVDFDWWRAERAGRAVRTRAGLCVAALLFARRTGRGFLVFGAELWKFFGGARQGGKHEECQGHEGGRADMEPGLERIRAAAGVLGGGGWGGWSGDVRHRERRFGQCRCRQAN